MRVLEHRFSAYHGSLSGDAERGGRRRRRRGQVAGPRRSSRLDDLVEAGTLSRERYAEIPPRVESALTADGEERCPRLRPLLEWAADRTG